MLKKTLINNVIALSVYGLLSAVAYCCIRARAFAAFQNVNLLLMVIACFVAFFCILCGFFLIPVENHSFLSVVSVTIAIIITFLICAFLDEAGLIYYILNPIAVPLLAFDLPGALQIVSAVLALLSPVYPSLLFYLGMVLRRLIVKR